MSDIQLNDIGSLFIVTLKEGTSIVDLSTATVKEFYFQKPDGTILTKTASFTTDGTDGKIQYTTIAGDLNVAGKWKLQAKITLPAWEGHSGIGTFKVLPNLTPV